MERIKTLFKRTPNTRIIVVKPKKEFDELRLREFSESKIDTGLVLQNNLDVQENISSPRRIKENIESVLTPRKSKQKKRERKRKAKKKISQTEISVEQYDTMMKKIQSRIGDKNFVRKYLIDEIKKQYVIVDILSALNYFGIKTTYDEINVKLLKKYKKIFMDKLEKTDNEYEKAKFGILINEINRFFSGTTLEEDLYRGMTKKQIKAEENLLYGLNMK